MSLPVINPEQRHRVGSPQEVATASEIPAFFRRIARYDREFIVFDDGWRGWTYSYADVARMSRALAAQLRRHGIVKNDRVIIWSESRPGWVAALWSCLTSGVVLVPVEPQASANLFHRIANKVQPRLILLGDSVAGPGITITPIWFLREIETAAEQYPEEAITIGERDVAEIVFTSGTTAEPKGVLMTHRNLAASLKPLEDQVAPYRKYFRLIRPFRALNLLPMSHLFGQAVATFLAPMIPASVVFITSTNPEEVARQIRTRRICALVSVPKILEVLREFVLHRVPEAKDAGHVTAPWPMRWLRFRSVHQLFGWRFCCFVVGGAPLPAELEQFWRNLGFVVAQGYGLTETSPIISFSHPFHVQPGTTGTPLAGVQVKIAEDGEVLVRGDNVTPGYFEADAETAAAFQDGWFRTGDVGELTPEGSLVIRGRKKEVIVTPEGLKVFPEDVEVTLNRIAGVRESAVVDHNGVHAVLVLEPGFACEDIVRQANQELEPHQRIRSVSRWSAGELPRTSITQKLRRAAIAAALLAARGDSPKSKMEPADLVRKYAPGRSITPDTTLEELGLSSLDRVELMMDLEESLQYSIDESAFASMSKVADLGQTLPRATPPISQPAYSRTAIARLVRRILLPTLFLPCARLFADLSISGKENLDAMNGPVVFAANHQSHLDTPIILATLSPSWRYRIAPAMWMEYFDARFFPERHCIRERWISSILYRLITVLFNAFPISQAETGTRQSLRYIGELVEEGWSILIFPEGERTETGAIGQFYPGVGMIAARMHVPIVPIRVEGLDRVLHRHATWPRRGPVHIKFGAPLWPKGEAYISLTRQVKDAIRAL